MRKQALNSESLKTKMERLSIKFKDGCQFGNLLRVSYELDENGVPVDIVIVSEDIEVLEIIAERYARVGYNLQTTDTPDWKYREFWGNEGGRQDCRTSMWSYSRVRSSKG